ncbi:ABC transporter substrate-binding protein [Cohnella cellulosilytica]|uniref:ABC transporter substrate-binding protein n=1 Tax=Cohnella cellulosilytica TaxID=986710 RepID=A0ABW2FBD5_9BACL
MHLHSHVMAWNYAALQLNSVGKFVVRPGESVKGYRLPAGTFLYVGRGKARVRVDDTEYEAESDFVCHAGRGSSLHIAQAEQVFEYYLIGYQAIAADPSSSQPSPLRWPGDPFKEQYGVMPRTPIPLRLKVEQMHGQWQQAGTLEQFHAKGLFHQFVYEVLGELLEAGRDEESADLVSLAVRYMSAHYAEPLTLESLSSLLNCTGRQLQRLFKTKLLIGPIDYLIRLRMDKAKTLLRQTDVPLKQIAEAVGYEDGYHFSRMFKKHENVSPGLYREQGRSAAGERRRHFPSRPSRNAIAAPEPQGYSNFGSSSGKNRVIPHLKGELVLTRKPARIVVLDYQYIDHLAALGEIPVGSVIGTSDNSAFPAYLADRLGDVKVLGTKEMPDLEAILSCEPDLIVCTRFQEELYDRLSMIAPTLMFDRNEDWRFTLLKIGRIVGKLREARRLLDRHRKKLERLQAALADHLAGKTVALVRPRDRIIRLHTTAHRTAELLYRDLGLAAPGMTAGAGNTSLPIPLETLPNLRADHLFVLEDDSNLQLADEFRSTPIWRGLEAVRENRVYTANTTLWVGYYGPIAIGRVLDEVAAALLRPAT